MCVRLECANRRLSHHSNAYELTLARCAQSSIDRQSAELSYALVGIDVSAESAVPELGYYAELTIQTLIGITVSSLDEAQAETKGEVQLTFP
jgi:hypothetical protein